MGIGQREGLLGQRQYPSERASRRFMSPTHLVRRGEIDLPGAQVNRGRPRVSRLVFSLIHDLLFAGGAVVDSNGCFATGRELPWIADETRLFIETTPP